MSPDVAITVALAGLVVLIGLLGAVVALRTRRAEAAAAGPSPERDMSGRDMSRGLTPAVGKGHVPI